MVAPHAGVADSDTVAGAAYARTRCRNIVILIGPNRREIAEPVTQAMEHTDRSVVIVVSTDMTHCGRPYRYRPTAGVTAHPFSYQEDQHAIDRMLMLDPQGLYQVVRQRHLTVCGVIPITAALPACQEPGATSATLVR